MKNYGNAKKYGRFSINGLLRFVFILLVCLFAFVPIFWAISTSLKPTTEITSYPPTIIPHEITGENYSEGVLNPKFLRYLLNTGLVFAMACFLSIFIASHAAYAMSRYKFFGKNLFMLMMFASIMIPAAAIVVPLYLASIIIGIYDTYFILVIVYSAWLIPTLVWLLRGFINSIPIELEESALMDGCNKISAFYRIVFPLMKPGVVAGIVFLFCNIWNEFLLGYCLVQSDTVRIIQVGIYSFMTDVGVLWGQLMAGAIFASIPVFLAYIFLQRSFIHGMSGGIKG